MSRIFITGSTDGLGLAAARTLMTEGHEVVLHARSLERAAVLTDVAPRSAGVVVGDLSSGAETRAIADQVNRIGRMNAVIHNAGIYLQRGRGSSSEGHATVLAVNTLAPYMLTTLIERPQRLIYLSSGMHRGASSTTFGSISKRRARWKQNGELAAAQNLFHFLLGHAATLLAVVRVPAGMEVARRTFCGGSLA